MDTKFMAIPVILAAVFWGIKPMLYIMFIYQFFSFYLISYYGGKTISYGTWKQLMDSTSAILVGLVRFLAVSIIPVITTLNLPTMLILQVIVGAGIGIILFEIFKVDGYQYLKNSLLQKFT